jgi:hypothetical protein
MGRLAAQFQIAASGDFSCILMFFQQLINGLTPAGFMPSSPWATP